MGFSAASRCKPHHRPSSTHRSVYNTRLRVDLTRGYVPSTRRRVHCSLPRVLPSSAPHRSRRSSVVVSVPPVPSVGACISRAGEWFLCSGRPTTSQRLPPPVDLLSAFIFCSFVIPCIFLCFLLCCNFRFHPIRLGFKLIVCVGSPFSAVLLLGLFNFFKNWTRFKFLSLFSFLGSWIRSKYIGVFVLLMVFSIILGRSFNLPHSHVTSTFLVFLRYCEVHLDYLDSGANIILTASYQATIQGFEAKGFSSEEAEALLRKSVEIACEAREIYHDRCTKDSWDFMENGWSSKRPILVAASVGSYGAYLADGSEYSGNYGDAITLETLKDFHRRRVQILANSGADLIAFETIPNMLEAKAYAALLEEEGIEIPAWFSFNSKDGVNVVSGDPISDCASIADSCNQVVAVGINCTPPRFIHGLITSIQKVTSKPVLVYPNSGETYDGQTKQWVKSSGDVNEDFVSYIGKWREAGASLFGGCCRTSPKTIKGIARALSSKN